jgi:hypothetical protein
VLESPQQETFAFTYASVAATYAQEFGVTDIDSRSYRDCFEGKAASSASSNASTSEWALQM